MVEQDGAQDSSVDVSATGDASGVDMSVAQLREWLRNWIADATGQPAGAITDDRPMEEFGLASRDAVALSGDIEDLLGITLTATVAYQHPTIASLATRIIEGEPEAPEESVDASYYASGGSTDAHDIAIVGLSTRFPGAGHTPSQMWEMLAAGRDGISDLPEDRWTEFKSDPTLKAAIENANTKGGYLDDVKGFDAEFFAMSPLEVVNVDPQQRLALELTWEALEHAHIPASDLKGKQVGVFIGSSANDYQLLAVSDPTNAHPYALTGTSTAVVANRVSYFFDFRGPSIALDTACSSSLVAVHEAVRSLRSGDSNIALAGGINMLLAPPGTLGFDQIGMLAPDGKLLGSAKPNFGHLEAAAGAAGLIKVVLAMQENKIPATLNYLGPNPHIDFEKAHLQVTPEATDWPRYTGKAIAGVSGFGFGGTNAHVVVREYVPAADDADLDVETEAAGVLADAAESMGLVEVQTPPADQTVVLAVSGALPSRRRRAAADLADWLETEEGSTTPLVDVARTLSRRNHGRSRAAVVVKTRSEAITALRAVAAGKPAAGVFSADAPSPKGAVWVFSGFGSQHRKMAKQLYSENSAFKAAVDEVDALIQDEAGYSVAEMFLDDSFEYNVETAQVAIFTIQVGLAALLRHHGADADAVVPHSMGEAAAAYVSGGLNLEDAVRVICSRSRLMGEAEGALVGDDIRLMALLEYSATEIEALLPTYPKLEVCVYAAPTHTVIGGPQSDIEAIVAAAEADGKMARVLQTKGASHTSQVDPLLGELAAELAGIETSTLKVGLYSSVDQDTFYKAGHEPIHQEAYWVKGLRHSVYFTNAVRLAVANGHTTFVELAPNPVTLMSVAATAYDAGLHDMALIQTLKRKEDESVGVLSALAQLYVHGHAVNLESLLPAGEFAVIPRTAFVRKPYWLDVRVNAGGAGRVPGSHVALPDGRHVWEADASVVSDLAALVTAAAAQVLSDVTLTAAVPHGEIAGATTVTTTLNPHPGGASVQVHARENGSFRLLFDAVVTSGEALPELVVAAPARPAGAVEALAEVVEDAGDKWDPHGSQSLDDRLRIVVAESMGYSPEDLPAEVPLIELGLDSLMAMRIKNRVEYEFDIPQLQLQAVKDASLLEVNKYLRYAIENREEVQAMADQQAAEKLAADAGDDEVVSSSVELPVEMPAVVDPGDPSRAGTADDAGSDVPPRDAAERLTFATWAVVTGKSAKGIFNALPTVDDDLAQKLAVRLSERAGGEVTVDDVRGSGTIEDLADVVRQYLEDEGKIDGVVRILRGRPEGSTAVPVFVFHPAGGSTVAYEPLLKRLPAGTPMYGFERTEGPIEKRAEEYVPLLREIQGDGPYVLCGWSLGGVLAYAVAAILRKQGADVRVVGMLDTVMAGEDVPDTAEERRKRWERYGAFAKRTYNLDVPLPVDVLAEIESDEDQMQFLMDMIKMSGVKIPGGIIEHQRTSFLDNRAIQTAKFQSYDGDVVIYMADKYHDELMTLEPAFKTRKADGGWGSYVKNLEVVYIGGDHLQIVDEPYISKVAADLTTKLAQIETALTKAAETGVQK